MSDADKRAALELHSLASRDRDWVLGHLPAAERARLTPLLAELDGMNIRFDLESAALPVGDAPRTLAEAGPHPAAPARSPQQVIGAASAADVVRALADEPAWLVRAVLALDAWPWLLPVRGALIERGLLRKQGPSLSGAGTTPPGQAAALLELLAERLRGAPATRGHNGHVNGHMNGHAGALNGDDGWRGIWPKVRQWLP